MKKILLQTSGCASQTSSTIKTVLIGLVLFGFASCTKRENGGLTNMPSERSDISQAQVLQASDLAKGMTLNDRVNGVDYLILSAVEVNTGRLIIKPGVTIMFEDGAGITVNENGSLMAIGEAGNEIYFASKSGKRGDWQGITVLSNSGANVISYCHIEHGGNALNTYGQADLIIGSSSQAASAEVSHNTIATSYATGVLINPGSEVRNFTNNNITSNTTYPVSMNIAYARNLQQSNTYSDNGKEFIELTGSGENLIQIPSVIRNINEPYALSGNIAMGTNLTISAGVQIHMNSGAQINIDGLNGSGSLTAVGSASQPIAISGVYEGAGLWNSINFKSAYSALNQLEYCHISGGGMSSQENYGMLNLHNSGGKQSQILMRNCTVSNSATNGIYIQKNALYNTDIETANVFTNNAESNIYFDVQ